MCNSLYVRANGELACWCDVGEKLVLRALNDEALARGREHALFSFPELVSIRRAFLKGRDPHPICARCAVHGHDTVTSLKPNVMQVLHIEPSFLCRLACPQCTRRRQTRTPPYNMPLTMFRNILRELQAEGVESVDFVQFEGGGDPMMNPRLGGMVAAAKRAYPSSFSVVTSNGNYPFQEWLLNSGLDVLRLSIDGAYQASYERYRVGGSLRQALDLMRHIRNERHRTQSQLQVEWKYILFEWNDSDEEIREAARLSEELEATLRFCLTHTEGKSKRFPNVEALRIALRHLAPMAREETTFPLMASRAESDVGLTSRLHYVEDRVGEEVQRT